MKLQEILTEALPAIKQFAPTIARAIGGPIGLTIGYIVPILSQLFDTHPADLKSLATNILKDPMMPDKLKLMEENHSDFIKGLLDNINDLSSAEITIKLNWESTE